MHGMFTLHYWSLIQVDFPMHMFLKFIQLQTHFATIMQFLLPIFMFFCDKIHHAVFASHFHVFLR